MRTNIFEKILEKHDLINEYDNIYSLFSMEKPVLYNGLQLALEEYIDSYLFRKWAYRGTFINSKALRLHLRISDERIQRMSTLDLDTFLHYVEYVLNMLYLVLQHPKELDDDSTHGSQMNILLDNIKRSLNSCNFDFTVLDNDKVIIIEKNRIAEDAIELVNQETANKIIEYNHYLLKGKLADKAEILASLAKVIEPMRRKLKANNFEKIQSDVGYLLNTLNIRHNNVDGTKVQSIVSKLSPDELEEWYDKTYQLVLSCIILHDSIDISSEIDELKKEDT